MDYRTTSGTWDWKKRGEKRGQECGGKCGEERGKKCREKRGEECGKRNWKKNGNSCCKTYAKRFLLALVSMGVLTGLTVVGINLYMLLRVNDHILTSEEAGELTEVDCIMVLGCGVRADGSPSGMLKDRLEEGIRLYKEGASNRLLMSGDHGRENYDEVNLMKQYAVDRGVPSEAVFMDHAGFSTYESMYRARDIFQVKRILVVTQQYHMYRALYVAQEMGMDAYGVPSDPRKYGGQLPRDIRELLARPKDLIYTMVRPKPTYLGEAIPVSGDGNVTNDK